MSQLDMYYRFNPWQYDTLDRLRMYSSLKHLQEQALLELKRELNNDEIKTILKNDKLEDFCAKINKVENLWYQFKIYKSTLFTQYGFGWLQYVLYVSSNHTFPCEASKQKTAGDGDCLIHGDKFSNYCV